MNIFTVLKPRANFEGAHQFRHHLRSYCSSRRCQIYHRRRTMWLGKHPMSNHCHHRIQKDRHHFRRQQGEALVIGQCGYFPQTVMLCLELIAPIPPFEPPLDARHSLDQVLVMNWVVLTPVKLRNPVTHTYPQWDPRNQSIHRSDLVEHIEVDKNLLSRPDETSRCHYVPQ